MRDVSAYGGRISVTEVLSAVGLSNFDGIDPEVVSDAAQRGKEVHEWTTIVDGGGEVPHSDLDPRIAGCVLAYQEFIEAVNPKIVASEQVVINDEWGYAGKLDRVFKMKRKDWPGTVLVLTDIKCPVKPSKSWRLQVAGYAMAYGGSEYEKYHRATLQCLPTGKYKLLYWDNGDDYNTFLAAVRLAQFMREPE